MNLVILLAAILISLLVFTWLVRVLKATLKTALIIAILVLALQLVFGIGPAQLWQQLTQLWDTFWHSLTGGR